MVKKAVQTYEKEARDLFEVVILSNLDITQFTLDDINEDAGALVKKRGSSLPYFVYQQAHLDTLEQLGCICKNEDGSYRVCRDSFVSYPADSIHRSLDAEEEWWRISPANPIRRRGWGLIFCACTA